jgi:hypothetical protein
VQTGNNNRPKAKVNDSTDSAASATVSCSLPLTATGTQESGFSSPNKHITTGNSTAIDATPTANVATMVCR